MNDTVNFEDTFLYILVLIKMKFSFKVFDTDCIMPGFYRQFFSKKLLGGLRVNYSVNIENYFYVTLVDI